MAFVQAQNITDEQHRDGASAGLQSRSSGIVQTLVCAGRQNATDTQTTQASGFLSSSTRFTTALHVVNAEVYSSNQPRPIQVRFGSGTPNPLFAINNFVADSGIDHGPLQYDESYRYDSEEEPYLPLRLFQLGLNEWAWEDNDANSKQWRRELRRWQFKVAPGHANDGSFYNQGFADLVDTTIDGEDIAVLEVLGLSAVTEGDTIAEIWNDLQAGKFPLNRPGVFFDHMKPILYTDLTNDKPLWMQHSNEWPVDSEVRARLISRPGYPVLGAPITLDVTNKCNGEEHSLTGLVGHTVDSKSGSSGGAILSTHYEEDVDGYALPESKLAVWGIHNASILDTNLFTQSGNWLQSGPVTTTTEPNPMYDGDNTNFFTGISNSALLREDPDPAAISEGDPETCAPGETDGCIPCEDYNSQDQCIAFTYAEPEIIADDPTIIGPVIPIDVPADDDSSRQRRNGVRRVNCEFNAENEPYSRWDWHAKRERFPGMVVGLIGASVGPFNNEDSVGDLMAICAPMSSKSYTENWHLLRVKGSVLPQKLTNLRGRKEWGPLNTMLTDSYTINDDNPAPAHEIRPTPMKFCPPTYIMTGLRVRLNALGIAGIFELGCKSSVNPNGPEVGQGLEEIRVGLSATNEGVIGYEMFGEAYTLDQRIGNPDSTGTTEDIVEQVCNGFVSGLTLIHDKNGFLIAARMMESFARIRRATNNCCSRRFDALVSSNFERTIDFP